MMFSVTNRNIKHLIAMPNHLEKMYFQFLLRVVPIFGLLAFVIYFMLYVANHPIELRVLLLQIVHRNFCPLISLLRGKYAESRVSLALNITYLLVLAYYTFDFI